jgi:esterase/lipase
MKKRIEKLIGTYFNTLAFINPKSAAKKGFILFCNPMSKSLKPYQISFLETGKGEILHHENLKIQTYKWGNGSKKVLLIHGWASHSFRWKAYVEHLIQNDFAVYAFDAPAHGLSSGKMLNLVLYSKIIDLFIQKHTEIDNIISHSIGSFAVVYWMYQHKENKIKKVVIMGSPGEAQDFFEFYKKSLALSDKTIKLIKREFIKIIGKDPSYFSAPQFAKDIQTQGLIIHDKEDKDTSYENAVKLHSNWKNSKLKLTEGEGHALKSKSLIDDVLKFIES